MLRWLRRTWVKLAHIGALLGVVEILTNAWGIAGDLTDALQQVGPDVLPAALRLIALVLLPLIGWGTLVAVLSAAWTSLQWLAMAYDTLRGNDRWAARELQSYESRIGSCIRELGRAPIFTNLNSHPGLRVHLLQLANELDNLGISIAPDDTWSAAEWRPRLIVLAALAAYGDIEAARSLDS